MTSRRYYLILFFALSIIFVGVLAIKMKLKENKPTTAAEYEEKFTPEQKEVLKALRAARADIEMAQSKLEKTKAELIILVDQAKATIISKGIDPNVPTTWIAHGSGNVDGAIQWAVRQNDPKQTPVIFGFRTDHLVMWKYADDKP